MSSWEVEPIIGSCWRMVELQTISSTRILVSSAQAHDRLEEILENGKPIIQLLPHEKECAKLHYLLLTPFRYPPLPFGSRFGTIHERGIFYASSDVKTAAVEKAFYRLFLARGTAGKVGGKHLFYTSFEAKIKTQSGIDLRKNNFSKFQDQIISKTTYDGSQALGLQLRQAGVQAFLVNSARTTTPSTNLNVMSPLAFDRAHVIQDTFEDWIGFYTKESVELSMKKNPIKTKLVFKESDFFVEGRFPHPPA